MSSGIVSWLGLLVIVLASVAVLHALRDAAGGDRGGGSGTVGYRRCRSLLTPAERAFYEVLVRMFDPGRFIVMCKVRVADVIEPDAADRRQWRTAWNRISQKHVDFLLVERKRMAPVCAIELNDSSHGKQNRQRRDEWLRDAFRQARMPLVFVRTARAYDPAGIRRQIKEAIRATRERVNGH